MNWQTWPNVIRSSAIGTGTIRKEGEEAGEEVCTCVTFIIADMLLEGW